jgi:hypothetical protein
MDGTLGAAVSDGSISVLPDGADIDTGLREAEAHDEGERVPRTQVVRLRVEILPLGPAPGLGWKWCSGELNSPTNFPARYQILVGFPQIGMLSRSSDCDEPNIQLPLSGCGCMSNLSIHCFSRPS